MSDTQADLDVLDVALRVARAIEACGGEYFVGGSVASSLQGEPRATNDIDFVLSFLVLKTPEDTVLRKLLWYRAGGEVSDRQWRDIQSVLRISGDEMDNTYLRTWAKRLDISDLLERAQHDS